MEQKIVDARGLACPLPVVNAKKALSEFKENGILTVLADNEIAVQNLKKFAVQKGLESWGKKTGDREYEVTIQVCCGESSDFRKWGSAGAGGTEPGSGSSSQCYGRRRREAGPDADESLCVCLDQGGYSAGDRGVL